VNRLDPQRAQELLERGLGRRVLIVGDVMLDVYLRGAASRISPEAPVPVVRVVEEWRAPGGAANVAANVAALGAVCQLVGCIGRDAAGESLRAELERAGIQPEGLVACDTRPTTVKTRVLARHQQVARYDREADEEVPAPQATALVAAIDRLTEDVDAVILEDYNKGVLVTPVIDAALDAARRRGKPIIVDPKADHFFDFGGATVFKPNRAELAAALRAPVLPDDPAWLERTRRHLDCSNLLITLGEDGMALMTEEGDYVRIPTVARSVYDVSGAGDTVTAVLGVALAAGADVAEAAVLANFAASVEVAKAGVATVSPDELLDAVRRHDAGV
jgi:rfaE bifunctional protein kinase chain/domain